MSSRYPIDPLTDVPSFPAVLRIWARTRPHQLAFRELAGGVVGSEIDFASLMRRVESLARYLDSIGMRGRRIVLVFPTSIDFVVAFLACLASGAVAVPSDLPKRKGKDERLGRIVEDSGASALLTRTDFADRLRHEESLPLGRGTLRIIGLGECDPDPAIILPMPEPAADELAMLQYTSGSTARPRGVMLTHRQLLANSRIIANAFAIDREDTCHSWLPAHHDMGLIGGILTPLLLARPSTLGSPSHFLVHPFSWLKAISGHGITVSGGPDFAYRWCIERVTPAEAATLDLSRWRVAFTGAEMVRPDTIRRFSERFACAGFRAESFFPCYGLAEATLLVSGGPCREINSLHLDTAALREGGVVPATGTSGLTREWISSGRPAAGVEIHVVDPVAGTDVAPDRIGEIWVRSPSVGLGYWENPVATRETFAANLGTDERPWLRTGDLGFLRDGRLYLTGRSKDLLIVRGANHAAEDLERSLEEAVPGLVPGGIAVVSSDLGDRERIVVLAEILRKGGRHLQSTLRKIHDVLVASHGIAADEIHLVKAFSLPRTSSGKVRRFACRDAIDAGGLAPLASSSGAAANDAPPSILDAITAHFGLSATGLDPTTRLDADLGLDSLGRVSLLHELARKTGARIDESAVGKLETVGDLVGILGTIETSLPPAIRPATRFDEFPEIIQFGKTRSALLDEGYDDPYFKVFEDLGGGRTRVEGRELIQFGSYHYLGFSRHPAVTDASACAARQFGTSAGASRLVTGNRSIHVELETSIARFLGTEAALAFVGGHATNETVIGHLFGPDDLILHDSLAHNSLIEGAKLSGARRWAFPHNDLVALDAILNAQRPRYRRVLVVVEGVYSMDGDIPDLAGLVELKHRHGALLMLDEAHSLGTLGASGRGLTEHVGVPVTEIDLLMGTLSKAFASCGGFIAGSRVLTDYLRHTAPGFVYSVGMPPASAAAALATIELLQHEPWRVERLQQLSRYFHKTAATCGIPVGGTVGTPVIPFLTGNAVEALALSSALEKRGFVVPPVLPPAVPENGARLRFFLTCEHSEDQIDAVLEALVQSVRERDQPKMPNGPTSLSASRVRGGCGDSSG